MSPGDPLFQFFQRPGTSTRRHYTKWLPSAGHEPEQDPAFAFRIMVDIASRAVAAIGQPHHGCAGSIRSIACCAMSARNSSMPPGVMLGKTTADL